MKFKLGVLSCCIFMIVMLVIYIAHIKFFHVDVVFYAAIFDGVIAALVSSVFMYTFKYFDLYNSFEKIQMIVIWLLLGYVFAISVPTVIDRSLSLYILEKLQQRGGGIELAKFEDVFTKEYMYEYRLVDVRVTEQLNSGTIILKDGCVILTDWGNAIATSSSYFRKNFLPDSRLLMGEYTDALTDPFKDSATRYNYECK